MLARKHTVLQCYLKLLFEVTNLFYLLYDKVSRYPESSIHQPEVLLCDFELVLEGELFEQIRVLGSSCIVTYPSAARVFFLCIPYGLVLGFQGPLGAFICL